MTFMFKLLSVLIAFGIVSDVCNLEGLMFNSDKPSDIRFMQSPSYNFHSADSQSIRAAVIRAVAQKIIDKVSSGEKKYKGG